MKQLRQSKRVVFSRWAPVVDDSLFALGVEVDSADVPRHLVEADVVEPLETGPRDGADAMVWNQKVLLPPHEDILPLCKVLVREVGLLGRLRQRAPCVEARPMLHVYLVVRTPVGVFRLERVLVSNDFAFEVCRESGMIVGQACRRAQLRVSPCPVLTTHSRHIVP